MFSSIVRVSIDPSVNVTVGWRTEVNSIGAPIPRCTSLVYQCPGGATRDRVLVISPGGIFYPIDSGKHALAFILAPLPGDDNPLDNRRKFGESCGEA